MNMEIINQYHFVAGAFIARVFLGVLFFIQGYDGVLNIGFSKAVFAFRNEFRDKKIPAALVTGIAWYALLTELVCGLLLIAGLFQYTAMYLLGLNLIFAAIGFGIVNPLWDTRHVFPRLVLLIILLAIPPDVQIFSLDYLFFNL